MTGFVRWVDGRVSREEGTVLAPAHGGGPPAGEGLYETLRTYAARPFLWERHVARLAGAAAALGFPPLPARVLRAGLDEALTAGGLREAAVRITVLRAQASGTLNLWIEVEPAEHRLWEGTRAGTATAILWSRPFDPGVLGRYKVTTRPAWREALAGAHAAGVDEAILVSPKGHVLEGSRSSVFAVAAAEVVTPPLALGILPGITRELVLELCAELDLAARERAFAAADLLGADEAFLTTSIQEVVPLARLDGRSFPGGPVTARIARAYRAAVARACGGPSGSG